MRDDGAGKDFKERRAQRTDFRVLPYIIKPPFPSDGGFAAASAGRSGPSAPPWVTFVGSAPAPRHGCTHAPSASWLTLMLPPSRTVLGACPSTRSTAAAS